MRRGRYLAWAVALLVVGAACGSTPPLPATEYFPAVESELIRLGEATRDLTDRYAVELEAEIEALVEEIDPATPGASEQLLADVVAVATTKMQTIIESHARQVDVFAERVVELAPPDVVGRQHIELLEAFRIWADSGEETIRQLGTATDLNDLALTLQKSPFADAQLRVDEACRELLENAATVGVVLSCPGTELEALQVGS